MKEHTPQYGVIYARYSSSSQRDESIEGQLRECHQYAKHMGITVIGEYCDHALSGRTDKRPEFQRMIKDSAKGKFSVVIVWKTDRFARSRYDSATYKYKLRQNGVRLVYAKENISDGPEGIVLESVMEGFAEYYSANLSQNVKRGMYDSALKLQTLSPYPYGLRRGIDGKWELHPDQAPIVKRIFDEAVSSKPLKHICQDLNNQGYRTQRGNLFNKGSLHRMFKNEKYYGLYRYGDIVVENAIPAIIDKETFDKVQDIMKLHHEKPALKKSEGGFLLTGKLFCGHCNEPMVGDCGTSKSGKVYSYYTCANKKKKLCDKKSVAKQVVEDEVIKLLIEAVNSDSMIDDYANKFMKWQNEQQRTSPLKGKKEQLKTVEKKLKNSLAAIDAGVFSQTVIDHIKDLEEEKSQLLEGIAIEEMNNTQISKEQIVFTLQRFRTADYSDISWRIYIIETFVKSIFLYDDGRLIISLNTSNDDKSITSQLAEKGISEGECLCSDFEMEGSP